MSASAGDAESRTPQVPIVFTGAARWVAAALLVIGPLLQVVEFLSENPSGDNAARVAYWAANPARIELAASSGLLAVPFLIGSFAVVVALTRATSPRLAWSAAALLTLAMVGLAAVHGLELAAYGLTRSGNLTAAKSVLDGDHLGVPGVVLVVMFLGGAALGTLTLAAAIWRSPLVPRIATVFVLGFAVLDFALGQGVISHLVNLAGLSLVAIAVVVGYSRRRGSVSWVSRSAWW